MMISYDVILKVLYLVLILFIFILFISYDSYKYWKSYGVKYIEPYLLFGNMKDVFLGKTSTTELMHDLYNRFPEEKYFGMYKGLKPILIVKDPAILKYLLIKDFAHFRDRFTDANPNKEIQSNNLINLKGKEWKNLRSILTPIFTSSKLKNMAFEISRRGIELQSYLEEITKTSEIFDVTELMAQFTTDVIGSCIFGLNLNSMSDQDEIFRKMGRKIFRPTFTRKLKMRFRMLAPKLFYLLNLTMLEREVTDFFLALVKDIKSRRSWESSTKNYFIKLLLDLEDTTDEFLMAQAFIFFAAGFETSSTLMSFALYELAKNPQVQHKLHEEIVQVMAKTEGLVNYETLKDLPYLDMVLKEALRKYPPAPILFRECTKDWMIPGSETCIKKGVKIVIPLYSIHRDQKHFVNPECFIPERFDSEWEEFAFLPFGEGPRNCIGTRFAKMQTMIGMIYFLKNFHVGICEKTPSEIKFDSSTDLLASYDGIHLRIMKR